ncbi:MAG TPA: ATP-binding cassette domain-containing protein [Cyclobacteriaceae bacterium]|nr:ATP-binding cassette domain-containing protein [Cyclobacteriaceae bacterium]
MIRIQKIDVTKSGRKIFEKFDWTILPNDHWVVSGDNGSGKTTLLEVIAGVLHVVRGEIQYSFIDGQTWDERYAQRKQFIHYVPVHASENFFPVYDLFYQQRYYSIGDERVQTVRVVLGNIHTVNQFHFPASFLVDELMDLPITRLSNGQAKCRCQLAFSVVLFYSLLII